MKKKTYLYGDDYIKNKKRIRMKQEIKRIKIEIEKQKTKRKIMYFIW
jgi:hypothetical protein